MVGWKKGLSQLKSIIKVFVSPSVRYEIRQRKECIARFLASLCCWKWKSQRFPLNESGSILVHYLGRPENKPLLMALLDVNPSTNKAETISHRNAAKIFVSEFPIRHALRIPFYLITIVKLGRSVEEILATYSRSLRRSISAARPQFRYQTVHDIAKIDALERNMLKPYAIARHDMGAAQLEPGMVRKFAQNEFGRLDLLYEGDKPVGCHLGNHYTRRGKRYWHVNRLGYPKEVFSDYKRWGEVNSINLHLALETAIHEGYDYCDYGVSLAKPGGGLIEWKRRRKGELAIFGESNYFYIKLPKTGVAQILWDSPMFAVEADKPTLHLGIPEGKTDEEIASRYHEMGYGGLYKVYLNCIKPPSRQLIEAIRNLYSDQESLPMVITYLVQ